MDATLRMTGAERRLGLYVALGGLMTVLDMTVTVVALPGLIRDFGTDLTTVQWVTTAYLLGLAAVMPVGVWATRRFGARAVYLGAVAVFTTGSLLAGLAWDVGSLIAFRAIQGFGGGLLNPVGMTLALGAVDARRRGAVMSVLGLPVLVGPLAGPLLGGLIVDHASWRWIFWINVPVGLVSVLAGRRILPRGPVRSEPRAPLDVVGLLLLVPGVTALLYGFSAAGRDGEIASPAVWLPLLAGTAAVIAFVRHARRSPAPLLRLSILRRPSLGAGVLTLAPFAAAYFGAALVGPAFVQIVRGDSATLTGLLSLPQAVATGVALQVASRLVDRVPARLVIGVGIAVATVGTLTRVLVLTPHTSYLHFALFGAVAGLGVGATLSPVMTAATRPLEGADLTAGSTVLNLAQQLATAAGAALTATSMALLANRFVPELHGTGFAGATGLAAGARRDVADGLAHAAQVTLALTVVLMLLAFVASRGVRDRPAGGSGGQGRFGRKGTSGSRSGTAGLSDAMGRR